MWRQVYRSLHKQRPQLLRLAVVSGTLNAAIADGCPACPACPATGTNYCSTQTTAYCESNSDTGRAGTERSGSGRKDITFRKRRLSIVPDAAEHEHEGDGGRPTGTGTDQSSSDDADHKDKAATKQTTKTAAAAAKTKSAMKMSYAIEIESSRSSPSSSLSSKVSEKRKLFNEFLSELGIKALEDEDELKDLRKHHHTTFAHPSMTADQELAFADDKVGAFSAHGIEPHPYVVRDEQASLLFSSNVEPQIVTLVTQKINQDRGIVVKNVGSNDGTALFGVFDGHGCRGELVADFVMREIPSRLEQHPKYHSDLDRAFTETYLAVDASIKQKPEVEPYHSGTTACVAVLQGRKLSVSNVGDSRAVIGRRRKDDSGGSSRTTYTLPGGPAVDLKRMQYEALVLTKDQNAKDPAEKRRVIKSGGYVAEPREPGLPARIYLDRECTLVGLAMSRSLGDHNMKQVGVIANPVITHHLVVDQDEFLILASDGVWEFLDSREAVRIVGDCLGRGLTASEASIQLIRHAMKLWRKMEGDYRDDITAIVVRLPNLFE